MHVALLRTRSKGPQYVHFLPSGNVHLRCTVRGAHRSHCRFVWGWKDIERERPKCRNTRSTPSVTLALNPPTRTRLLQVVFVAAAALSPSLDPALLCCYISCSEASWHSLAYHHAAQPSGVSEPIVETRTRGGHGWLHKRHEEGVALKTRALIMK